jgi:phenylalanyl-tRNA synthetase beta chain
MGGKNSEVSDQTQIILLEAAIFDPVTIRRTVTRTGLQSEASRRFQHGLTQKRLFQALDAAIKMYQSLGGRLTALTIVGDTQQHTQQIDLSLDKVKSLIGVDIPIDQIKQYLSQLYFHILERPDKWQIQVPFWRLDIKYEEDLIEEVARMYGYAKIPANQLQGELPGKVDQSSFELIDHLKTQLVDLGLTEVQTYSFFSTKTLSAFGWNQNLEKLIKVANPMSAVTTYLRQNLWSNLLEVINKNIRQAWADLAVFEIGKFYSPLDPKESYSLAISLMNGSDNPIDELYSISQKLLGSKIDFQPASVNPAVKEIFHPQRFIQLKFNGQEVGGLAEVHPRILDQFGINKPVAVMEIQLSPFKSKLSL